MIKDKSLLKASVFTVTLALTILSGCSSGGDGDSNEANSDIISDGPRDNSNDEAPDDGDNSDDNGDETADDGDNSDDSGGNDGTDNNSDDVSDDNSAEPEEVLIAELRVLLEENGVAPLAPPPEISNELFDLGQALSFDKILSGNKDISCMTCHHPEVGSDDNRHLPQGVGGIGLGAERTEGAVIARNSPSLFNLHLYENMFWDGRVEIDADGNYSTPAGDQLTAEMIEAFDFGVVSAQAMFPVTDALEMRGASGSNELANLEDDDFTGIWAGLMARLAANADYVMMFELAYPGVSFGDMSFAHAANAIAAFEIRGFDTRNSPWNQFVEGDDAAMSSEEVERGILFYDAGCGKCHTGSTTSDFKFHTLALAQFGPGKGHGPDGTDDFGREGVTGDPADRYDFRTPPLFNVELTGPWGHAGQFSELGIHIQTYSNLETWRRRYVQKNLVDDSLWSTIVDNSEAAFTAIEEDFRVNPIFAIKSEEFDEEDFDEDDTSVRDKIAALRQFVRVFTDDRARDMSDLVPDSVPSGLPMED